MSVLQDMTKDIMTTKATKASKLTPVAGETGMTVAQAAVLPNDVGLFMSNEVLIEHAKSLREFATTCIAIADGIDGMVASPTLAPSTPKVDDKKAAAAAAKAAEKAADEKHAAADDGSEEFGARMKRLQEEAQASTFTAADDDGTGEEVLPEVHATNVDGSWVCPLHGDKDLSTITPRKGDPYLMCDVADCEEYER